MTGKDLAKLTKEKLSELCDKKGIVHFGTKAELIAKLKQFSGDELAKLAGKEEEED